MQSMNFLIKTEKVNYRILKSLLGNIRILSTEPQSQDVVEHKVEQSLWTRVLRKKGRKPPFIKNIFLGKFDFDLLTYPEVLNKEELNKLDESVTVLQNNVTQINKYLQDSTRILTDSKVHLSSLNVFGLQSPKIWNGMELNNTETCRLLEALSENSSLAASLIMHQSLGVNAFNHATEQLRKVYVPKLSTGEKIACACLLEDGNPDLTNMKTRAKLSSDGKALVVNGSKSWVVNGSQSDVYMVLAIVDGKKFEEDPTNLLVVDKSFGGITTTPCKVAGFEGADICDVTFENTPVPLENVIGKGSDGVKIVTSLLAGLRLNTGALCISTMKTLLRHFSNYCLQTRYSQKYLAETDFTRGKLAEMALNLYAMESMTYLTAGLLDDYEEQDTELEAAVVKVFSSEKCLEAAQQCAAMLGAPAFMKSHWVEALRADAAGTVLMNETNDSLRMVISLLGLQHAGLKLNTEVKMLRNPFFNPGYVIKKMWVHRRQDADDPKLEMGLEDYLHPSLTHGARWLEYCVYRLQYATESMLIRYGPAVVEQHMVLRRLANVAVDVYAMAAVLGRSSRSYCIGLRNADREILLANAFCLNARERVKSTVLEIVRGPYGTNDVNYQKVADQAFKCAGNFAEHPLTKNF